MSRPVPGPTANDTGSGVLYVNGNVVTVDAAFSTAQCFAVVGDRFAAVGTEVDVRDVVGSGFSVVDLGGRTVVPGFIDTHAHTVHRGATALTRLSLAGLGSVAQICAAIGTAAASSAPGAWIVTSSIGEYPDYFHLPEGLAEGRWPTRHDLDRVAPANPVYVPTPSKWPHPAIFNSRSLEAVGVTADTPDEGIVKICRDDDGEPTGVIYGLSMHNKTSAIYDRILSFVPPPDPKLVLAGMREAFVENIGLGVTSIYEGHGNVHIGDIELLRLSGELEGRVISAYEVPAKKSLQDIETWMAGLDDARGRGSGTDRHKIVGVTVSLDGPTQWGLALMNEPYLDPFGNRTTGTTAVSFEKLVDIVRLAVAHDLRLNVQAAGDAACEMAVAAFRIIDGETPLAGRDWVVMHFQHPSHKHISALRDFGVYVQTYSSVDFSKGAETYRRRFSSDDIWPTVVPLRWFIDAGVVVAQSSDGGHYDPMFQIWESLVRVDGRTGESLLTDAKKITRQEALQIYTINGARLIGWADRVGSIEVGKLADFVVLDNDIMTCPVDQIAETSVVLTAVGGEPRYDPLGLAPAHSV